jgi:hypothetical protein
MKWEAALIRRDALWTKAPAAAIHEAISASRVGLAEATGSKRTPPRRGLKAFAYLKPSFTKHLPCERHPEHL